MKYLISPTKKIENYSVRDNCLVINMESGKSYKFKLSSLRKKTLILEKITAEEFSNFSEDKKLKLYNFSQRKTFDNCTPHVHTEIRKMGYIDDLFNNMSIKNILDSLHKDFDINHKYFTTIKYKDTFKVISLNDFRKCSYYDDTDLLNNINANLKSFAGILSDSYFKVINLNILNDLFMNCLLCQVDNINLQDYKESSGKVEARVDSEIEIPEGVIFLIGDYSADIVEDKSVGYNDVENEQVEISHFEFSCDETGELYIANKDQLKEIEEYLTSSAVSLNK